EVAAQLGKLYRDLRRITSELSSEFNESMQEIQNIKAEVQGEVADIQNLDIGLEEPYFLPKDPPAVAAPVPEPVAEPVASATVSTPLAAADGAPEARDAASFDALPATSEHVPASNGRAPTTAPDDDLAPPY